MNSNIFKSTSVFILSVVMLSEPVFAQDISHENITATTSLGQWSTYSIEQISDGISVDCAPTCNGFTTNAKTGPINFSFNEPHDIDSFKLWNDVNIRKEGIKVFYLEFKNTSNATLTSEEFEAASSQSDAQIFTFPKIQDVVSVKLNVLSSLLEDGPTPTTRTFAERIEVREIGFTGTPASARSSGPILVENPELLKEITRLNDRIKMLEEKLANSGTPDPKLIQDIEDLKFQNDNQTDTINKLNQMLKEPLGGLAKRDALIEKQASEIVSLKAKISELISTPPLPPRPSIWPWKGATAALGLLSTVLGGALLLRKPKTPSRTPLQPQTPHRLLRPSKPLERPEDTGVLFAGSPLLAANVAAPLSTAGQLTASSLQMLSGPFAILRPAYKATGRIGYAQIGKPSSEDYAFGTGFLITPNHVMTNRHVHGFYSEYLTGDDCGGIEFIAEKDKEASDFYDFDGNPPLLVPGLDIAIYTLAETVENREPIAQMPLSTETLEGRDIVVIGYPDSFNTDDPDLLAALEDNPVFAVKRISQGQIFRHSTDIDDPYGVQATVTESETTDFLMPAISHNASTMTGNSGSPILDAKTGELLGVHFAGYKIFNEEEAANLAMAIDYIVRQREAHSSHSNLKTSTGLKTA